MKKRILCAVIAVLISLSPLHLEAQSIERKLLTWEQRSVNIGAVLEERGEVEAEFFGVNLNQDSIWITDVFAECGCTTVGFTKDTLSQDKIASLKVKFNPDHRGGDFAKQIIVRTNMDIYGDTLVLEGTNIPVLDNLEKSYPYRKGNLGFRLPAVNMGNVFTNEPKLKHVELHNFGKDTLGLMEEHSGIPEYIAVSMEPATLSPGQRGLLLINYDGEMKNDLGYFEENITLSFTDESQIDLKVMSVVHEYFQPVPKSLEKVVPKLGLSEIDIDLKEVSTGKKVSRNVIISNMGEETLKIRKVSTNCECVDIKLVSNELDAGQRTELSFTFDPKGRRGIDHKHITVFSNDPINPVRTIVIKSSIK
ncbi:DUF1573 domain-containing protein [Arthrospiribacter ruber]|uniref:DUF1573 domain-containing protein n=1 Tax=Arthrospiribacter ruber TaxID=2487934 RepID=A0A951IW61_9BACT|nr:DUF1573 domain-containing protein [Arthrospiribacter ruber]MBW3468285.1 DUF1573 domain-containing protein [Arthrospiribacter ruber]